MKTCYEHSKDGCPTDELSDLLMKRVRKDSEECRQANRGLGDWLVHHVRGEWAWLIAK